MPDAAATGSPATDTIATETSAAGSSGTALERRAMSERWRAARAPLLIGLLVLLGAVVIAATAVSPERGLLNPEGVDGAGSRAVTMLLRAQGVTVTVARGSAEIGAAGPDATVLVPFGTRLSQGQLTALRRSGADLVLVAPGQAALAVLAPGVEVSARASAVQVRVPGCALPAALAAGAVELGGELYRVPGGVSCYQRPDQPVDEPADEPDTGAPLVRASVEGRTVTVLGAPDPLTNGSLADQGNAALALRLLGGHRTLYWFLPGPETPAPGQQRSIGELVPPGWRWGAMQLGIAVVLAAVWRARRLGPVVAEPLPVVVRAVETVEGRGRLYRRAAAPGHAAEVLRGAARARLAARLGLGRLGPARPGPGRGGSAENAAAATTTLVDAVAAQTGRPAAQLHALLYGTGGDTVSDPDLIELVDRLDACEREVRRA